jgi:hypothetical protein
MCRKAEEEQNASYVTYLFLTADHLPPPVLFVEMLAGCAPLCPLGRPSAPRGMTLIVARVIRTTAVQAHHHRGALRAHTQHDRPVQVISSYVTG